MKRITLCFLSVIAGLTICVAGQFSRADDRTGGPTAFALITGAGDNKGKINGHVTFTSEPHGVRVVADVEGLTPGKHGFHIHEGHDLTAPDLSGAGPHWNPGGHKHGGPEDAEHHLGDLGNLVADEKGVAHYDMIIKGLTINDKETGVIGHSVIIHEKEDDLKSQPAGDSGKRIAGGVIVSKTEGENK